MFKRCRDFTKDRLRTRAVHGFEPKLLLLDVDEEHVLLVMVCMPARLPQVKVVDVGRHHLLILILPVQLPDVLQYISEHQCTPAP